MALFFKKVRRTSAILFISLIFHHIKIKFDGFAFAPIDAGTAQNAFRVLHFVLFHHLFHGQTHRAVTGASMTMSAISPERPQLKGGPIENVSNFSAHYHEGRHPADMMTK